MQGVSALQFYKLQKERNKIMAVISYNSCLPVSLGSIDARCDISFGGIKRMLIALKDDVDSVVIDEFLATYQGMETGEDIPNDDNLITQINMKYTEEEVEGETVRTYKTFYEFLFRRNTASYTSTVAPDVAIGNSFATTEVTLQFSKAEAKKRMIIQSLINAGAVVILEDMYGQFIYLGKDREVVVTNGVMQSGTAETDLNGFTLTLQDVSLELPHFICSAPVKDDGDYRNNYVDIELLLESTRETTPSQGTIVTPLG